MDAGEETEKYEASRDAQGGKRDKERESKVAALWNKAAIQVRPYDWELAHRLEYNGAYWLNPDHWTPKEIGDARIELVRVIAEAKTLLKPKLKGE